MCIGRGDRPIRLSQAFASEETAMGEKSFFAGSVLLAGAAVVALTLASLLAVPREAKATAQFAQQTGKPCGFCHSKPPALNAQGKKFKTNGHKL